MLLEEFLFVVIDDTVVNRSQVSMRNVGLRVDNISKSCAQVSDGLTMNRASKPAYYIADTFHVISYDCAIRFHELQYQSNKSIRLILAE